jgi:hypothetical protein
MIDPDEYISIGSDTMTEKIDRSEIVYTGDPDCCTAPILNRTGTGCDEVYSWGCFTCNCGAEWRLFHNFPEDACLRRDK